MDEIMAAIWEHVIVDDFVELREAGLSHPSRASPLPAA